MRGPNLAKMAWRNLWRNLRRTLITLSGIAFGVLLAVLFTGMADSSYSQLIDLAARMGGGHVTYQHPDYLESPSLKRTVKHIDDLKRDALEDPEITRVVPRISGATMLATAGGSYGAFFVAVDPTQEDESTLAIAESISEGEMFDGPRGKGIILGAQLAKNLEAKLGRKVVYTMTDKHGEIVSGLARVVAIVETGAPGVDSVLCFLPIDTARDVLGYEPHEAIQVAMFLDDQRASAEVAARLQQGLDDDASAVTWRETQPDLAAYITIDSSSLVLFELILMVLISAGIFNTLFVSVMERLREFGILMAIGFRPGQLFRLVMWESLWLGICGLIAAAFVTIGPYYYYNTHGLDFTDLIGEGTEVSGVAMDPIVYVSIFPDKLVIMACLVVLATLLSGLYPAWRAGRVAPVESIKLV